MRFLIVKTSALGDLVQTYPVVSYLKERYPMAEIDWVVERAGFELIDRHPLVSKALLIDSKKWRRLSLRDLLHSLTSIRKTRYDAVFDLQGNTKSALLTMAARSVSKVGFKRPAEIVNCLATNCKITPLPNVSRPEEYLSVVKGYFHDHKPYRPPSVFLCLNAAQKRLCDEFSILGKPSLLICPGSAWQNKQLTLQQWVSLLVKLPGSKTYVWGNENELKLCRACQMRVGGNVLPLLPLPVLQNLMPRFDLVIAMDSLPLHLAASAGAKTYSVFGPTSGKSYAPLGHPYLQGACPYNVSFIRRCPYMRTCKTGACTHDLTTKEILSFDFPTEELNSKF